MPGKVSLVVSGGIRSGVDAVMIALGDNSPRYERDCARLAPPRGLQPLPSRAVSGRHCNPVSRSGKKSQHTGGRGTYRTVSHRRVDGNHHAGKGLRQVLGAQSGVERLENTVTEAFTLTGVKMVVAAVFDMADHGRWPLSVSAGCLRFGIRIERKSVFP